MTPYPIRGAFKPNQNYVCLSCLLSRPFAPSRQSLRFKSTNTIGIYPTPDPSVAALLWSQQEATAKGGKQSEAAKRKGQKGQIQLGKEEATKPASVARTKAKSDGARKVSKASGDQRTVAKAKKSTRKPETPRSVPKSSTVKKGPPVSKKPTSLMEKLQEKLAQAKAAALFRTSKALSDKDEHLGQTPKSEEEHTTDRDNTSISGQGNAGSGAKATKRLKKAAKLSKKASTSKSGELTGDIKEGFAKAPAHDSGSVEDSTAEKHKSPTTMAKASKAKAAKPLRIKKFPLVRKLATVRGDVARRVRGTQDLNAVIKKTEAALERRDEEVRLEAKKERLAQARQRSRKVSTGRKDGTKYVKLSDMGGARSIKEALKQETGDDVQGTVGTDIETVNAAELDIAPILVQQSPVPGLSYGLDRVLFNPGVYHLQDPRSRVFNFDPYLKTIMPVSEFDFNALKEYITSSRDESLKELAESHGKRYVGSSSSMTGALAHFHFLLSQWREINANMLSRGFPDKLKSFTKLQRAPSAIFLRWRNGTYAIDADKEFDSANVLMMLGKSMEKLLTLSMEDYERYRLSNSDQISSEERNEPESFHYSTIGDFLMRSQLDAHDPRLPGTGMFDLKTRAVISVRMDTKNYEEGVGYQIKTRQGGFESFEREYFDMIRAAFLKYSLQVRMGRMDGIFVAFHNTERVFGFQYISLPEMDATLHGQYDTSIGDQEFKLSLDLLNKILDRATKRYPEQSLRIHFETRDTQTPFMYVFAEPVTEEQVYELQNKNKEKIAEFERNILGLHRNSAEDGSASKDDKWADIRADVEEAMTKDEESLDSRRDQEPFSAAVEHSSEIEDDTALEQLETVNRGLLYEGKGFSEADDITAATTADEVDAEDEEDNVSDEEDDENAEDEGENDDVVQEGEEEDEADIEEDSDVTGEEVEEVEEQDEAVIEEDSDVTGEEVIEVEEQDEADIKEDSDVIGELAEEVDENGDEDELDNEASNTTNPESSDLDSIAEAEASTEASELMADAADAADPNHEPSDPDTPLHDAAAEANPEPEPDSEAEDSQTPGDASFLDSITLTHPPTDLLALTLTIRNKVNNEYVLRPSALNPTDAWSVEYSIAEVAPQTRAWSLYQACQKRRKKLLDDDDEGEGEKADYYLRRIQELSRKGREWRVEQDRRDEGMPVFVVGEKGAREEGKGEGDGKGKEGGKGGVERGKGMGEDEGEGV